MSKEDSEKSERPPAGCWKDAEPELPYRKDSGNDKVAQALIAGERDRKKLMRDFGVSINTIYNVTKDLAEMDVPLAIHQKKKINLPPPVNSSSPNNSSSLPNSFSPESVSQIIPGFTAEQSASMIALLSGRSVEKASEKSAQESTQTATPDQSKPADPLDMLAKELFKRMGIVPPEVQPEKLPGIAVPTEDVELVGEKINYKVALNPEIFYRFSVFKARAVALGKDWNDDFSDFLDIATKDVLSVYVLYPTVLTAGLVARSWLSIQ